MTVEIAIDLVLSLIDRAGVISQIISNAREQGQTTLTVDQWKIITDADDAAHAKLVQVLAAATP